MLLEQKGVPSPILRTIILLSNNYEKLFRGLIPFPVLMRRKNNFDGTAFIQFCQTVVWQNDQASFQLFLFQDLNAPVFYGEIKRDVTLLRKLSTTVLPCRIMNCFAAWALRCQGKEFPGLWSIKKANTILAALIL